MDPVLRNTLSVFLGLVAVFLCGLILYPLVQLLFDKYFQIYLGPSRPKDAFEKNLIILITIMIWVLLSSIAGGLVCSLMATKNEWIYMSICAIIMIMIFAILSKGDVFKNIESILSLFMIPIGFAGGRLIGGKIKTRRQRRKTLDIEFENPSNDAQ